MNRHYRLLRSRVLTPLQLERVQQGMLRSVAHVECEELKEYRAFLANLFEYVCERELANSHVCLNESSLRRWVSIWRRYLVDRPSLLSEREAAFVSNCLTYASRREESEAIARMKRSSKFKFAKLAIAFAYDASLR